MIGSRLSLSLEEHNVQLPRPVVDICRNCRQIKMNVNIKYRSFRELIVSDILVRRYSLEKMVNDSVSQKQLPPSLEKIYSTKKLNDFIIRGEKY